MSSSFTENMSFAGSFSYKNDKNCIKNLGDGLFLKIERLDHQIAWMFFENEQGIKVEIPQGVTLHNISDEGFVSQPDHERYLIHWSCNYRLMKNGEIWIRISNQRQQSIQISDPENLLSPNKSTKQIENDEKVAEVEKCISYTTI